MSAAGRVSFVTGTASGIGRALVDALVARGERVVAADVDETGARAVAERHGDGVRAVRLDVTDPEAFARAVADTVATEGRLDALYNNAGVALWAQTHRATRDDWKPLVDVNLWGVIHGVRAAYPHFVERGRGHIVNTASLAGLGPSPWMVGYAATKHAVVGLSTSLRAEAAGLGVRVSVVCPGPVATPIFERSPVIALDRERLMANVADLAADPTTAARAILAGVDRNRAVIVVGARTRLAWWFSRLAPALTIRLTGRRVARVR